MIYLDNAATTKVNDEVLKTLNKLYSTYYFNANSPYYQANQINELQEQARIKLASILNVNSNEIIYTSGGSEANNMAIKGIAFKYINHPKKHIISSFIEHSSVYETMQQLEKYGFEVTYLRPNEYGYINNDDIIKSIKENTILISIAKINSELGTINDVENIYDKIKMINKDIMVHIDYVQALGKIDINLKQCDLGSFAAHKINGVKGSGFLYKKQTINITPLITGGVQEFGLRAGTSNYYFNIILTKTLRLYQEKRNDIQIGKRFDYIFDKLENDNRIVMISDRNNNSGFIINFSILNYKPEVILNYMSAKDIFFSTRSACSSNIKRSRIIEALPINDELKDYCIRISFDLETSVEELDAFYCELDRCLTSIERVD